MNENKRDPQSPKKSREVHGRLGSKNALNHLQKQTVSVTSNLKFSICTISTIRNQLSYSFKLAGCRN